MHTELLNVESFAKRLNISRTKVFEWKRTGILKPGHHYIKRGRILRFIWDLDLIREIHDAPKRRQSISRDPTPNNGRIDLEY